jgi:hypothetical protein
MRGFDEREVFEFLDFWKKQKGYEYTQGERDTAYNCAKSTLMHQAAFAGLFLITSAGLLRRGFRQPLGDLGSIAIMGASTLIGGQVGWTVAMPKCMQSLLQVRSEGDDNDKEPQLPCQACMFIQRKGGRVWERYKQWCSLDKRL